MSCFVLIFMHIGVMSVREDMFFWTFHYVMLMKFIYTCF